PEDINITQNEATVAATATISIDTYLMKLAGVPVLATNASSAASTASPKLEIVMVLDVSGSMGNESTAATEANSVENGGDGSSVTKMAALKVAAKQFVDAILDNAVPGNASIAIVPFSTSAAPSPEMFDALLVDERHSYSTCLTFDEDDHEDRALPTDDAAAEPGSSASPIDQVIYTSRFGGDFDSLNDWHRSCYTEDYFAMMPFSMDKQDLHDKIDSFIAKGMTSGDLGVKWATAMLDPSFREVTADLVDADIMPSALSNVPANYDERANQKVIVMMGDGANTTTRFFPKSGASGEYRYRGANSDLYEVQYVDNEIFDYAYDRFRPWRQWHDPSQEWRCSRNRYECVYDSETVTNFFLRDPTSFDPVGQTTPSTGDTGIPCTIENADGTFGPEGCDDILDLGEMDDWDYEAADGSERMDGTDFVALRNQVQEDENGDPILDADGNPISAFGYRKQHTWEYAWGRMSPEYFTDLTDTDDPDDEYQDSGNITGGMKDTRMSKSCNAAKANTNITVYTIGFEIDAGGNAETQLRNCATDATHYYRVEGVDISAAFNSIAEDVQALRLTQ
ncbi:MAG: hypothetical protein AAGF53_13265, partial [Pseudomonadota bacterium]